MDAWTRRVSERPRLARAVRLLTRLPTGPPQELARSGVFCFVSEFLRRRAEEWIQSRFPRATIVHGGIDTRDFPLLTRSQERPWRWRLLYVGRLHRDKGASTAVEAVAALPQTARLELVGYGGSAEFLFDGVNCLRFPPGDAAGLARAVETLAVDNRLRHRLVASGLQTAARFTADDLTNSLEVWLAAAKTPR